MNFKEPVLEKIIRRWKWTRKNTMLLLKTAQKENILKYSSSTNKKVKYTFQPLLFQFQCIVSTTDVYYRKLVSNENTDFGILVIGDKLLAKKDISVELVKNYLEKQMKDIEEYVRSFSYEDVEKHIKEIVTISDHEYLHQGEMILMFREAGIDLPERFKKAWAL